jgi:hypothetical protein
MPGASIHDYLTDHAGFDWPRLLAGWAWLLPPEVAVWLVNRFGDLFLALPDGSVHALDVTAGTLTKLAGSREEFCELVVDEGNADQWLMAPLVDELVEAGLVPGPGQCYGFKFPPVLGGGYTAENTTVLPAADYLGYCGSLHRQLAAVPDGGHVVIDMRNGPGD